MKRFDMAFPESVAEACQLLADHPDSRLIAGGTALTVVMKQGVYQPELLVNIRGLEDDLRYVREEGDEIHIGALATLRDVERSDLVAEHLPAVVECLGEIAGVRVRNTATIGGHLAHADVHLDLPPVLAGLGAEVVITDGEESRQVPLDDFLLGYYETAIEEGELLESVVVPKADQNAVGVYLKHRYFSEVDWPCVGVVAFATYDGEFDDVRVLLNSVGATPVTTIEGIDEVVDGDLSDDAIEAVAELAREQVEPTDDLRGSADYKRRMSAVFTRRALGRIRATEVPA